MQYDSQNREIVDQTPVAVPLGYRHPESLQDMIKRMVRIHSMQQEDQGNESFEEADDFEIDEENDAIESSYQLTQMQEEYIDEPTRKNQRESGDGSVEPGSNKPTSEREETQEKEAQKPMEEV